MSWANVKRVRRATADARRRYEGSWLQDLLAHLTAIKFGNSIVLFGASLLLSVLPLLILLGSLGSEDHSAPCSRSIASAFECRPVRTIEIVVCGWVQARDPDPD
jgi:hypothetical protein